MPTLREPVIIRIVNRERRLIAVFPTIPDPEFQRADMCQAYTFECGYFTVSHGYYTHYTLGGANALKAEGYNEFKKRLHELPFSVIVYDSWLKRFDRIRNERFDERFSY